jgi:ABC-type multidrug transport system fused ATPase/permease subunit
MTNPPLPAKVEDADPTLAALVAQTRDECMGVATRDLDEVILANQGRFGFSDQRQTIATLRRVFELCADPGVLTKLSPETLETISNSAARTKRTFELIAGLPKAERSAEQVGRIHKELSQELETHRREIETSLLAPMVWRALELPDYGLADAQLILGSIIKAQNEALERLAKMKQINDDLERVAQGSVVSIHTKIFSQEADDLERAAAKWLIATAIAVIVTAVVVAVMFFALTWMPHDITEAQSWHLAIAKVAMVTIALTATVWIGRIYRTTKHNQVVNRHRANALNTFTTFVNSAGTSGDIRATVLLQASQCIFSPQPSGFVPHDTEGPSMPMGELIRGIGQQR